jgi:hypothetical protein
MTMIVNNTFRTQRDLMMQVRVIDIAGKSRLLSQQFFEVGPTTPKNYLPIGHGIDHMRSKEGLFLSLRLVNTSQQIVSDNLYWLPDSTGNYSGLQHMAQAALTVEATRAAAPPTGTQAAAASSRITVTLRNPAEGPLAFFNRVSLVDATTKQRLLPVFYTDNYLSILPGESKTITLDYTPHPGAPAPLVSVRGWNVAEQFYPVK